MPNAPVATRFFMPETSRVKALATVANLVTGPTRAELTAGTDISRDIAGITGWASNSAQIATPDMGKRFVSQIPGRINVDDSSIMFYASKDGQDIRTILTRDASFFIVFMDGGDVTSSPMDVFKTTVSSVGKPRDLEDALKLNVSFTIRDFSEGLSVPAQT